MATIERTLFQLGYQISPVILTGGIAQAIPGGMLPLVAITQAANFTLGLLQGSINIDLDSFFAHFEPMPGATLVNNQFGEYPFANQAIAANSVIAQPLSISLLMKCPANTQGGYISKLMTMTALQTVLAAHNSSGGTYTVATPSFIYSNCLLPSLRDVSNGAGKQVQTMWQWDFVQPLITQAGAAQALSGLMSKIDGGLPISGIPSFSGIASSIGSATSGILSTAFGGSGNVPGAVATAIPTPQSTVTALL